MVRAEHRCRLRLPPLPHPPLHPLLRPLQPLPLLLLLLLPAPPLVPLPLLLLVPIPGGGGGRLHRVGGERSDMADRVQQVGPGGQLGGDRRPARLKTLQPGVSCAELAEMKLFGLLDNLA